MKRQYVLLALVFITFCGFVAKIRYQKVIIETNPENTIEIDGEKAVAENGKYLLAKTQKPHIIVAKRDGYKDARVDAIPYESNGYTYPAIYTVGKDMAKLPEKLEDAKNLRVNTISIDLKKEDNLVRYFSDYKTYLKKKDKQAAVERKDEEDVKVENTIYSDNLNDFLKTIGFIDTSDKVFKNGFLNNLITNVTVTKYIYHRAPSNVYQDYGGMMYVELEAKWELMNIYEEVVFSFENKMKSDHFVYERRSAIKDVVEETITDALTYGLIEFMSTAEVKTALKDKSTSKEETNFTSITLPKSNTSVSSLSDAIKSSITVKSKNSHGSGFIISSEGHIITNYHVISEAEELEIVMNDNSKHEVEVVRVSKIHDLALLKIKGEKLLPFKIERSKEIALASDIFAVGTPKAEDLSQTVSKGIISGIRKTDQDATLIQIDASINSGNSGGAIVNPDGVVIGVVSSKLFGFGVEGVGFGIPAYEIYDRLKLN